LNGNLDEIGDSIYDLNNMPSFSYLKSDEKEKQMHDLYTKSIQILTSAITSGNIANYMSAPLRVYSNETKTDQLVESMDQIAQIHNIDVSIGKTSYKAILSDFGIEKQNLKLKHLAHEVNVLLYSVRDSIRNRPKKKYRSVA